MWWLWILVITFLVTEGASNVCETDLDTSVGFSGERVKQRSLRIWIIAPEDLHNTSSCELTAEHRSLICDRLNHIKSSWPASIGIICDKRESRVHVSPSLGSLKKCSGQSIELLFLNNCTLSWEDVSRLTQFAEPQKLGLKDVSFKTNIYVTGAPGYTLLSPEPPSSLLPRFLAMEFQPQFCFSSSKPNLTLMHVYTVR